MVFWYCKWVFFKLFNNLWVWDKREGWGPESHPTLQPILSSPIFLTLLLSFFVKIKSIVAVGVCCILRKVDN